MVNIGNTYSMRPWLRTPLARAVLPIAGGIAFFVVLFGVTWLMATYVTDRTEVVSAPGNRTFVVGKVADIAKSIAEDGPVLYTIAWSALRPSDATSVILVSPLQRGARSGGPLVVSPTDFGAVGLSCWPWGRPRRVRDPCASWMDSRGPRRSGGLRKARPPGSSSGKARR